MNTLHRFLMGSPGRSGLLERLVLGVILAVILMGTYQVVGHEVTPGPWSLETSLDRAIPFLPWTVWFYVVVYAFVFLIPLSVLDERPLYNRAAAGLFATALPCWTIHALFPIAYPRPAAPTGPSWSEAGMRVLYTVDLPQNTFPSMHVGLALVMVLAAWQHSRRAGLLTGFCATLMTISVLTTKQHFIADIAGGWVVAMAAWAVVQRMAVGQAAEAVEAARAQESGRERSM